MLIKFFASALCLIITGLVSGALVRADPVTKWVTTVKTGTMVIEDIYDRAHGFSNGLAAVSIDDLNYGKWGYINHSGQIVIAPQFDIAGDFQDGIATVGYCSKEKNKFGTPICKYGVINTQGRLLINPKYSYIGPFKQGVARVQEGDSWSETYQLIDKNGAVLKTSLPPEKSTPCVVPQCLSWNTNYHEGLATFVVGEHLESARFGYHDVAGAVVISAQFELADPFSEGLAAVAVESGMWGFIDRTGHFVINPIFKGANRFSEGLAWVFVAPDEVSKGFFGFISKDGATVIPAKFELVGDFSEGLCAVALPGSHKWGYISR